MALAWTLDKIGPMCRSADDCALVLHEIAGADAEDPGSARKGFPYNPQFDRKIPNFPYGALVQTVISAEAASIFEDFIRSGQVDQMADRQQAAGLKAAIEIPAVDYLKAMRIRSLVRQAFRDLFVNVDLLLAPARGGPAPPVATALGGGGGGTPVGSGRGLGAIIPAGNLAGLPAISLPSGLAGGLPVAISIIGRPFFDNHVIGV